MYSFLYGIRFYKETDCQFDFILIRVSFRLVVFKLI